MMKTVCKLQLKKSVRNYGNARNTNYVLFWRYRAYLFINPADLLLYIYTAGGIKIVPNEWRTWTVDLIREEAEYNARVLESGKGNLPLTLPYLVWPSSAREAHAAPRASPIYVGWAECYESTLTI